MKFGKHLLIDAEESILAHSIRLPHGVLKKGRVLQREDIDNLRKAGHKSVIAASLEEGDIHEDIAVHQLAATVSGKGMDVGNAFTGRCNLHASNNGLLVINTLAVDEVNLVSEAITIASLPAFAVVTKKQMLATVKSMTFSIADERLQQCIKVAEQHKPMFEVIPFTVKTVGFIQTRLPGTKEKVLDKTSKVLNERLAPLQGEVIEEIRCEHGETSVADATSQLLKQDVEMIIISGASAVVDRRDVIPVAVEKAGGKIKHFGMPVDPGNLLLLAELGGIPVIGMPGCARSPKENGFDMVLQRLMASISVEARDIMRMGVGGLLKETSIRIQPRESKKSMQASAKPHVAALVLAAGQSSRMGKSNKLLMEIDGKAMLKHVIATLSEAELEDITVVTGHEAEEVKAVLDSRKVKFAHNPDYEKGISSSLICGLESLEADVFSVLVCLGDMPLIKPEDIKKLISAFDPVEGREICVPVYKGKRGNPVLWSGRFFTEMKESVGDTGAKRLLSEYEELVYEVPVTDSGVLIDFDTQQALTELSQ